MKPDHIILVRHGQSEGNVNKEIYGSKPDYAMHLTETGIQQATIAGKTIAEFITNNSDDDQLGAVQFYVSPFWRARQTYELISKNFPHLVEYEDPRLREQEWGHLKARYAPELEEERDAFGHFYYRFPDGESCADVFDRMSDFLNTMHRDFEKPHFPRNTIIVSHGMTMRLFLMRWFHLRVEDFELLANPKNCECYVLKRDKNTDKYSLMDKPRKYEKRQHPYQYEWEQPRRKFME